MRLPRHLKLKHPILLVAGLGGLVRVVNLSPAQTWTPTSAPSEPWRTIACSADGAKVFAAGGNYSCPYACYANLLPIYVSTDFGMSWNQTSSRSNYWTALACSADGSTVIGAANLIGGFNGRSDGRVYTSTNGGASWAAASSLWTDSWTSVACSADGTKLLAAGHGIYLSSDSGATWAQVSAPTNGWSWSCIASSADGTKLFAARGLGADGLIYTSTNSGLTWNPTAAPYEGWTSLACSADGTKCFAAAGFSDGFAIFDAAIYVSTNTGATWTEAGAPVEAYASVACSSDGTHLVAADSGYFDGGIYTSTDSGVTWTATGPVTIWSSVWSSVACSADGTELLAATPYDSIYYVGPVKTEIGAASTTVATNFAIELDALTVGDISTLLWDFGDGQRATNSWSLKHAWGAPGDYTVILTA